MTFSICYLYLFCKKVNVWSKGAIFQAMENTNCKDRM